MLQLRGVALNWSDLRVTCNKSISPNSYTVLQGGTCVPEQLLGCEPGLHRSERIDRTLCACSCCTKTIFSGEPHPFNQSGGGPVETGLCCCLDPVAWLVSSKSRLCEGEVWVLLYQTWNLTRAHWGCAGRVAPQVSQTRASLSPQSTKKRANHVGTASRCYHLCG